MFQIPYFSCRFADILLQSYFLTGLKSDSDFPVARLATGLRSIVRVDASLPCVIPAFLPEILNCFPRITL